VTIRTLLVVAALACASQAAAQTLTLQYQQVLTRLVPGATAAFSLDPSRVAASVQNSLVTLEGRGPGSTNVIVIVGDSTVSLQVVVGEPPLSVLPGMRIGAAGSSGSGYYEARFGSDPAILQGTLRLSRRERDRSAELSIGGAAPLGMEGGSRFSIPLSSFTLRTPNREITLMDRVISNSPLTISRSNVRGVYLQQGPWQVNAGYSFFSTFENLLLPTSKEGVVGLAYRHRLSPRSTLTPNLFYFTNQSQPDRSGPIGTVVYETRTASDVKFVAELGVSRSVGGAAEIEIDRPGRRGWAKLRIAPPTLPSLTTDQQSGRQIEGGWIWQGAKASLNASLSSRRYVHDTAGHTSSVASVDLRRQLTSTWAVHGGSGVSLFENGSGAESKIRSLTLPVGTSLLGRHLGLDLDYQFSRETTRDLGGHLLRANLHGNTRGFRFTFFGERQTQAPTVRQILTEVSWLRPMLDRLGLVAGTPQQLADLLRTNAELSAYGYANRIELDVTPIRTRIGASAGWSGSGPRRPQLFVSTLLNRDDSIDRMSASAVHSVSYSQHLDGATELFLTWSALCHDRYISSSSCRPALFASVRRSLSGGPGLLMPRRGAIEGIVFKDDRVQGMYTPGLPPMAGVDVVLDDVVYTKTDSLGRFRFDDVPYGRHRVEARHISPQPTFFTTPSPAEVDTGSSVNFGIALSRSSLRGVVHTDSGTGLPNVLVHIAGTDRRTTVRTADDGSFVGEGLPAGDYDVTVEAGSVPAGYPLDGLVPQRVRVEHTTPGRAAFVLRPHRSVAGRARLFNRSTGQYVALAGAVVELQPLRRQSVTDANGQYTFRDLAAGEYTVVARHAGREYVAAVSVPDGPGLVKNVNVAVLPPVAVVAEAAPTRTAEGAPPPLRTNTGDDDRFTIQVAASTTARYARAMVTELKAAGYSAYLIGRDSSGARGPYRVCIGQYASQADANQSARALESTLGWRMSVTTVSRSLPVGRTPVGYVR
jgi:hypothetical protein